MTKAQQPMNILNISDQLSLILHFMQYNYK